jgi:hypothetical protein
MSNQDEALMSLARAIAAADQKAVSRCLDVAPSLARASFARGAARSEARDFWLDGIGYAYAGATALHVASAAHNPAIARMLISAGADVAAADRHGAQPIHLAAMGMPGDSHWTPSAQVSTIDLLVACGADPNAVDKRGVTPLHRAVRCRCADAVEALLERGADARCRSRSGSTPMLLATRNTGRGGSGSQMAKAQRNLIIALLRKSGAD